jgi:hypothetical protein
MFQGTATFSLVAESGIRLNVVGESMKSMSEKVIFRENMVHCPKCGAVPHFQASLVSWPPARSGHCLYLLFECEQGHKWEVHFDDHSAGIWISEKPYDDASQVETSPRF